MTSHRIVGNLPPAPASSSGGSTNLLSVRTLARDAFGREIVDPAQQPAQQPTQSADPTANDSGKPKREAATESIARRAGALSDELDFPEFVASLVHGTFDAMVDASIRQMESFADLVSAVAKPLEQFTQENVTPNQARDWLVEQYPKDLVLVHDTESFRVTPREQTYKAGEEKKSPDWLADFGLADEELTPELVEEQLLPIARERVARHRLQTLSTMVLLGMNRIVIKDGTISARLRFRAEAGDHAKVDYAVSDDPSGGGTQWGQRGSSTFSTASTKVSTVGVNVQSDSDLKAELFGEVKINFASETLPLDRFVDDAKRTLLERHARSTVNTPPRPTSVAPAIAAPSAAAATPSPAATPEPSATPSAVTGEKR